MALKLTWVNHASFIVSDDIVTMISDPWLEGTAFNDSWKLLSPTVLSYADFKDITHIWFSHEHPDHFAPLVIQKISPQYRENITVLYQNTIDRKVVEFCRQQGFKSIIEINPGDRIKLSPTMIVSCRKVDNESDSWLLIETPDMRILNLNDCHFNKKKARVEKLKQIVGDIDLLLTQFSYAQWIGNHDQPDMHRSYAQHQLDEMKLQLDVLKPKMIIPFASYIWFCHEENYFMNISVNRIRDVYNSIPTWGKITTLVFYPGDVWDMTEKWDKSEAAIARYEADYNKVISSPNTIKTNPATLDELKLTSEEFRQRYLKTNNTKKLLSFPPFTFYLTDYSRSFQFSFRNGLEDYNIEQGNTDISLSSQAMWYCFKYDWGFGTLYVSGRFEIPPLGNYNHVQQYEWVADLMNIGKKVPGLLERMYSSLKQAISSD